MRLSRLSLISVIYNLKERLHELGFNTEPSLDAQLPLVKVITKDAAYTEMSVPSIVVYMASQYDEELQLGGGYWIKPLILFDIYAGTDGELLDLVDVVREYTESVTYLLRYDQSPPTYQVSDGFVRPSYSSGTPQPVAQIQFENRTVTFLERDSAIGEMRAHTAQVSAVMTVPNA